MSNPVYDKSVIRNIILESQHLITKSTESIEDIVSDICGLQYDPYPAIQLNQYMMLWNRKKDFTADQLDTAAYKKFKIIETWTFKRNMFFVPYNEFALYRTATKGDHGFNEWRELSETEANQQVLDNTQIIELANIIERIENHYGFPCDIEWAFEDNTFYVVQSRPITTLGSVTPLEKKWYQSYNWKVIAGDFNSPYFRNNIWVQAAKFYESDLNLPRLIFGISAKDNDIEYIADMSSWKKAHEQIKERTDNDIYYVENNFIDAVNNFGEKFNQWSQENILEKDLSKFENIELVALYKEFIEKQARLYAYGFSLPVLDFGEFSYFEGNLEKILQNKVSKDEFKEYYKTFTQPYLNSFSQDQDEELLKILAKYETDSDFIKDLKNLSEKEIARKYPDFWNDLENHTKKHTWVYYVYAGPAFSISQFYNFITSS